MVDIQSQIAVQCRIANVVFELVLFLCNSLMDKGTEPLIERSVLDDNAYFRKRFLRGLLALIEGCHHYGTERCEGRQKE